MKNITVRMEKNIEMRVENIAVTIAVRMENIAMKVENVALRMENFAGIPAGGGGEKFSPDAVLEGSRWRSGQD